MLVNEEEAKKLRCCGPADCGEGHWLVNKEDDNKTIVDIRPVGPRTCIASGCMAWRWLTSTREEDVGYGFCGLANG